MPGSLRERSDGVWELRVAAGWDPARRRYRQVSKTVRGDRKAAERELKRLVGSVRPGGAYVAFGDVLDRWWTVASPHLAATTRYGYASKIAQHIRPALGSVKLAGLRAGHLTDFYALLTAKGLAPSTVRQCHAIVRGALKLAVQEDWVDRNVATSATLPKRAKPEVSPPTPAQIRQVLAAAETISPVLVNALVLSSTTGMRRGEVVGLQVADADLDAGVLHVRRSVYEVKGGGLAEKDTKTHQVRRVPLSEPAAAALRRQLEWLGKVWAEAGDTLTSDACVFLEPSSWAQMRPSWLSVKFAEARSVAGVPHCRLHDLRHAVGTQLLAAGYDARSVAEILGHASAVTTLSIYAHAVPERVRDAADHMGRLLGS